MIYSVDEKAAAVIFMGTEGVTRELLYAEFQAILDGFIPLETNGPEAIRAVYVEIDCDLHVTAAVFFSFMLNQDGFVERSWNLPLLDLARTAEAGPNMGAGPIKLVCKSQNAVELFSEFLWDPKLAANASDLTILKKAIKRNKLGIQFKKEQPPAEDNPSVSADEMQALTEALEQRFKSEMSQGIAQLERDQRLRVATITTEKEAAITAVRQDYIKKMEVLQRQAAAKAVELKDVVQRNAELKQTIDGQASKIQGLREYFEQKLERTQHSSPGNVTQLHSHTGAEIEAKVAAASQELKDLLSIREAELGYRKEQEQSLNNQLSALKREKQELLERGGDGILERLNRKAVSFVTYQPGAGHVTIPLAEIALFLESPEAFTANCCGVSNKHYADWLQHYKTPVCMAFFENGETCGVNIPRVTAPLEFTAGESDCCAQHNLASGVEAAAT